MTATLTTRTLTTVTWRDEFSVGVQAIDEQHRRLIDTLGRFYEVLGQGMHTKEALGELLASLLDYTRYHFSTEEELMERTGFLGGRAHKDQHAAFVAKVTDMADRFSRDRLVLSIEATAFIRDWLFGHILVTDKALGRHLTSHGLR